VAKPRKSSRRKNYRSIARESRYHRLFGLKAAQEAERVLSIFEKENPRDKRPRRAIAAIKAWSRGQLKLGMHEVRRLSLDAHAAARKAKAEAARFAARAAGHAVATWHVPTHAMGVPMYAAKARIALNQRQAS